MRRRVYVETSVVGAYFDDREDVASVAQRFWSRRWWEEVRPLFDVVTSEAVVDELSHPDYPSSSEALRLVSQIPRVSIDPSVREIVRVYIEHYLMPRNPVGDALHLALASLHKCDFLLTWNCTHLANPNKFLRIRIVNGSLGLFVPTLVTPNQLLGASDD